MDTEFTIGEMAMYIKDFGWMTSDMEKASFYTTIRFNMMATGKMEKKWIKNPIWKAYTSQGNRIRRQV